MLFTIDVRYDREIEIKRKLKIKQKTNWEVESNIYSLSNQLTKLLGEKLLELQKQVNQSILEVYLKGDAKRNQIDKRSQN